MPLYVTLIPAYGRDYKTEEEEVLADWEANKDFIIQCVIHPDDGRYINKQDAKKLKTSTIFNIRYNRLSEICVVSNWA